MIDLRRVLVPLDFGAPALNALKYAAAFAEKFTAELHLLHVVQDLTLFLPDAIGAAPVVVPQLEQLAITVRESIDQLVASQKLGHLMVHAAVRQGTPFDEIVRYATEANIDLIVMGTHGKSVITHLLFGSVTEKVVRKAPCPVLTVHDHEHEFVHP